MQPQPGAHEVTPEAAYFLPPRVPGKLARYPRKLKCGLAGALILLLAVTFAVGGQLTRYAHEAHQKVPPRRTDINQNTTTLDENTISPASPIVTSTTAPALNDQDDRSLHMLPAPDPALTEESGLGGPNAPGGLPRIAADGREPWRSYARPFNTADQRPRVAIVIADTGMSRMASDAAINRLPANVTLAVDSQNPVAALWADRARQDGHEILLIVPMEPFDYPRSDPGPGTLLTSLPNTDNIQRLKQAMKQASGYVGVTSMSGTRFTTEPEKLKPVLEMLHERGLMFFDARVAPHSVAADLAHDMRLPAAAQTSLLDSTPSAEAIDQALADLERKARLNGRAIGVAFPLPVVIDRIQAWAKDLPARGIALAPVSAMVQ